MSLRGALGGNSPYQGVRVFAMIAIMLNTIEPMIAVGDQAPEPRETARQPEPVTTSEEVTWQTPERDRSYGGDTSLKIYLCEICKVELLKRTEEEGLGARVTKGEKRARGAMM